MPALPAPAAPRPVVPPDPASGPGPGPALDALAAAAALCAGVPTGVVCCVDAQGRWTPAPTAAGPADADALARAACVVAAGSALVVADDPVDGWAGAPLRRTTGELVGALLVLGPLPHGLDPVASQLLPVLAAQVVAQLELAALRAATTPLPAQAVHERPLHVVAPTTRPELLVAELELARDEAEQRSALLDGVLDTIDVGVVACDAHGRLTLFNRATRSFHGMPEDPGLHPDQWAERYSLRTEDGEQALPIDQVPLYRALVEGEVHDLHITIAADDRPDRVVRCDGRALRGPDGTVVGAVVAMKDVTDLRASEQRFRSAFQNGPTPMARLDPDGTLQEANPALRRFLALPTSRLLGRNLTELLHPEDRSSLELALTGTGSVPVELRVLRSDGAPIWCELATTSGIGPSSRPYVLAQLLDVQARKNTELALEQAARVDPLTGLGNRSALDRELTRLLHPTSGTGACVLFIDLDGFKQVNDTLGHEAGDAVLVAIADRLRAALRPGDTATRTGGDEFVVACPLGAHGDDAAAARALTARLEEALAAPVDHEGTPVPIAASIGSALALPGDDVSTLVVRADQAMYVRKAARRGGPVEQRRRPGTPERRGDDQMRDLLAGAVEEDRLRLQYQPVLDLQTGAVVGTEALLRLHDRQGNVIAPDRFVPVAESDGSIGALSRWCLHEAFAQTARWKAAVGTADFGIGVNVSPLQLHDAAIVRAVEDALAATGLEPTAVVLEITASRLVPDTAQVRSVLSSLAALGVHLAVDDFGAGFASSGYLSAFPFDLIKVDRRYTSRLRGSGSAGRLARGVFALARETGLVTVAEGVETAGQAAAVMEAGCLLGQGYLWSRPVEAAELATMLPGGGLLL